MIHWFQFVDDQGNSKCHWFADQSSAQRAHLDAMRTYGAGFLGDIDSARTPKSKREMVDFLNLYAGGDA